MQSTARQLRDDPNAADTPGGGAAKHAAVLTRLELIRSEAMAVLDRMHGGDRAAEAVAAAGASVGAQPTPVYGTPDGVPNPTETAGEAGKDGEACEGKGVEGQGLEVVEGVAVDEAQEGRTG